MLCGIDFLSYGQLTNRSLSFSALADIYKLNKVTKAFAEGDTRSLIDIMSFTLDETYIVATNVIPDEEPEIFGADALTDLQTEQLLTLFNP